MDILQKYYPNEDHLMHQKCADDALSAHKVPKQIPKNGKNWGVPSTTFGPDGKPVHGTDGKVLKHMVRMADGHFNGQPQPLYFPPGHEYAGIFKGMSQILIEQGLMQEVDLRAQCKDFQCEKGATACCCHHVLYNQPDFITVELLLESVCKARGFNVLFWPKFHCEMSMILVGLPSCICYVFQMYPCYILRSPFRRCQSPRYLVPIPLGVPNSRLLVCTFIPCLYSYCS
jgi:hypothetical protein